METIKGIYEILYDNLSEYNNLFLSFDFPVELKVIRTELHVIHIIIIKTTQTYFCEGSFE
jgi:hypothetical protein